MTPSAPYDASVLLNEHAFRGQARARLLAAPIPAADAHTSPSDYDLNPEYPAPRPETLKPAAVLVPILSGAGLNVLLTERTEHLSAHGGQIAFPGGKIDPGEGHWIRHCGKPAKKPGSTPRSWNRSASSIPIAPAPGFW